MNGSGTIRVLKRDGTREGFDRHKLAGAMWRAIGPAAGRYRDAAELSLAIGIYLRRRGCRCVTSAAVLEMAQKVLRRVGLEAAADAMDLHRRWRAARRRGLLVRQEDGRLTCWEKSWVAELACRSWDLRAATGRIIAGEVEKDLLSAEGPVARRHVLERMNELVGAFGLAQAVPVRQYALE